MKLDHSFFIQSSAALRACLAFLYHILMNFLVVVTRWAHLFTPGTQTMMWQHESNNQREPSVCDRARKSRYECVMTEGGKPQIWKIFQLVFPGAAVWYQEMTQINISHMEKMMDRPRPSGLQHLCTMIHVAVGSALKIPSGYSVIHVIPRLPRVISCEGTRSPAGLCQWGMGQMLTAGAGWYRTLSGVLHVRRNAKT